MFAQHDNTETPGGARRNDERLRFFLRLGVAGLVLLGAVAVACVVMVPAGEARVITRFGNPNRVVTEPGLAWKLPAPIESTIPIDLRLRTTSTGLQDVGTRDGLRVLVQSYVAWQVPSDPQRVRQFLRSVRNQPDEAARQLRSFVSAAMHIISSNFDLAQLVNMKSDQVQLDAFEQQLRDQVAQRMLDVYGIEIRQVGVERMTLPDETLAATVARMRAERETVAAERTAEGLKKAAAIRADADREARETVAEAREQAARTEADAQQQAAKIYGKAYMRDPELYSTLRSLDTINQVVNRNTSLVLRTDAAPFRSLGEGPVVAPARAAAPQHGPAGPAPAHGPAVPERRSNVASAPEAPAADAAEGDSSVPPAQPPPAASAPRSGSSVASAPHPTDNVAAEASDD